MPKRAASESWGNRHGTGQVCVVREKHFPWDFIMHPHGWETPAVHLQFSLSKIPGFRSFLTVGEPKWPPSRGCSAHRQEPPGHGRRCFNYAALWSKGYVTAGHAVSPRWFFDSDIFLAGEKYQLPLLCLPLQTPPQICCASREGILESLASYCACTPYPTPLLLSWVGSRTPVTPQKRHNWVWPQRITFCLPPKGRFFIFPQN